MIRTTIDEASTHLRELVEAALRGEEVVITTDGESPEQTVRIVANAPTERHERRRAGSARGLIIHMSDDFDEPLEGFEVLRNHREDTLTKGASATPSADRRKRPGFGSARGIIHMSGDFDEPLEEFEEYKY